MSKKQQCELERFQTDCIQIPLELFGLDVPPPMEGYRANPYKMSNNMLIVPAKNVVGIVLTDGLSSVVSRCRYSQAEWET